MISIVLTVNLFKNLQKISKRLGKLKKSDVLNIVVLMIA